MANIPEIDFNKIPNKNAKFNQAEFYEANFEKVNEKIVPKINELDTKVNFDIPAQLVDIENEINEFNNAFWGKFPSHYTLSPNEYNGLTNAGVIASAVRRLSSQSVKLEGVYELSFEMTVDKANGNGQFHGFSNADQSKRFQFGYEPAHSAFEVYSNIDGFVILDLDTNFENGEYIFKFSRDTFGARLNIKGLNYDKTFNIKDYIAFDESLYTNLVVQFKIPALGNVMKYFNFKRATTTLGKLDIPNSNNIKKYSEYGETAGRNRHIYSFGGKGNDWCYVITPEDYDPQRVKPYPFVIQNHGNGSNFDGTPQNTIWTTIAQYRPQAEYDADPSRFLLSPSPDLDYSSPTIEALLDAGYVVCGAMNYADGLYGNVDCRNAMADFYQHMIKNYNVEEKTYLMGASNGFMTTLNGAYLLGGVERVKAIVGVYPLADLISHYFNYANHRSAIELAYGITSGLTEEEFKSATRTHNYETMNTNFPPIKTWYSLGDSITVAQYNALSLSAKLESDYQVHEEVAVTGQHGDQSHFNPSEIVAWFEKYR